MRIVVSFAVPSEFSTWRRLSRFTPVEGAGAPIYRTQNGQDELYAVITGIGTRHLQSELRQLFAKTVDVCIASGLAGALKKEHRVGSILVAKTIKEEAGCTVIQSQDHLVEMAAQCGAKVVDFFCTAKSVVHSSWEKQRLAETADAVDVESFHIMSEAHRAGVPAVAVRAVSDPAENNLPINFNRVINTHGQIGWAAMLSELAKAPSRVPSFVRFGIDSFLAARNLACFLDRYVRFLTRAGTLRLSAGQMVM